MGLPHRPHAGLSLFRLAMIHSPPCCFCAISTRSSLCLRSRSSLHSLDLHPTPGNSISHTGSGTSNISHHLSLYHLQYSGLLSFILLLSKTPMFVCSAQRMYLGLHPFISPFPRCIIAIKLYSEIHPPNERAYTYVGHAMNSKYRFPPDGVGIGSGRGRSARGKSDERG